MEPKIVLIPQNNAAKYFSHREAWGRIKRAIAHGFYFEAVTLEESIISDRLCSYFCKKEILTIDPNKHISFNRLIQLLKEHVPEPIVDPIREPRFTNLQESLMEWKNKRNHVVHGIVKSVSGDDNNIEDFITAAEVTAREGCLIAESVNNWYRRYKDKLKAEAKKAQRNGARATV